MVRAALTRSRPLRIALALLALLLAIVAIASIALNLIYNVVDVSSGPMLVAGRRGDVASWPENTLEGMLSAAEQGADAIEMDVRRSADGTFYLMHDADVARTTNGRGLMEAMSDRQIDGLIIDGGMGYAGQEGLRVPRLSSVVAALGDFPGVILLDAKGSAADHAAVAERIGTAPVVVWISCGTRMDVDAVGGRLPTYGPAGADPVYRMADSPLALGAFFERAEVSPIFWWWTGNETDAMARAQRWGVKVYITNDLAAALAWSRQ